MPTVSFLVGQNHLKSLSTKLDTGRNSLQRISPTAIKPIRTATEPFIVNPYHTRYNGEHITAMVISIISDAKNVFIPMFLSVIYFFSNVYFLGAKVIIFLPLHLSPYSEEPECDAGKSGMV